MRRIMLIIQTIGALFFALASASAEQPIVPPPGEIASAEFAITDPALKGHIRFLADDLLEGRAPGSRG